MASSSSSSGQHLNRGHLAKRSPLLERPPAASSGNVVRVMKGNRGKGTSPELIIRKALWRKGIRGYRLNVSKLPGSPDIVFTSRKVALFVQGCFWHRCRLCSPAVPRTNNDYWTRKFVITLARDRRNRDLLESMGWIVLEVWECQIRGETTACVDLVRETLLRRDARPPGCQEVPAVAVRS
jgi:DNA mismatch endonuclease, patch repair protein